MTLVLLDVDGTLVDLAAPPADLESLRAELITLAQRHGAAVTHQGIFRLYGAMAGAGAEAARQLIDGYELRWAERAVPLVEPAVWTGLAGVRTALVTSNGRACIDVLLERGVLGAPDVVVTRDDCARLKPDPEPLRLALRQAAALALLPVKPLPAEPVPFVGDSEADRAAAQAWRLAGGVPEVRFVSTRDVTAAEFLTTLARKVHL